MVTQPLSPARPSHLLYNFLKGTKPKEGNQNNDHKDLSSDIRHCCKRAACPPMLEAIRKATGDLSRMLLQNSELPG